MTSAWRSWISCLCRKVTYCSFPRPLRIDRCPICRAELAAHLFAVRTRFLVPLDQAFDKDRVALMIAGFDVPHTHIHLFPADGMADYDPANAKKDANH